MKQFVRAIVLGATLLALVTPASAATQEQIDAAIAKGAANLKKRQYDARDIGPTALAGLAILESGARFDEPAVKAITDLVRTASYAQEKTYPITLCLLYLDRNGDPADVPLVQMLAVRLLAGQTPGGGWGYNCLDSITPEESQALMARLRNAKVEAGKLHPDVAAYARAIAGRNRQNPTDDNSNTQFGIIGLWVARKHAVPVEAGLDLVVERFLRTQDPNTGGWFYSGGANLTPGSPSMTCAGLLALATGAARRDERLQKLTNKKPDPAPKTPGNPSDPFFSPGGKPTDKPQPKRAADRLDVAIQKGFWGLGASVVTSVRAGNGRLFLAGAGIGAHGENDLYFFWSLERVGVVYGVEKIGGVDWYGAGADTLVLTQDADGGWQCGYGNEVGTAFAVLFLLRANVVKDLKMNRNSTDTELRSASTGTPMLDPKSPMPETDVPPRPVVEPKPVLPPIVENETGKLAKALLEASPADWDKKLLKLRDTRGGDNTSALVLAIPRLTGERKQEARDALAERLVRMNAETLRDMMKSRDVELRRAAVLAAAMKDEKAHIPDLIECLLDDEELVVRAARAGLKSLSDGKDFGPQNGSTRADREAAAKAWREWAAKK